MQKVAKQHQMAMILITHNFGVIARVCDRVAVMYAGRIVEQGPVAEVLGAPRIMPPAVRLRSQPTSLALRMVSPRRCSRQVENE